MKKTLGMKKLVVMMMAVMVATVFLFAETENVSASSDFNSISAAGEYLEQSMLNHNSAVSVTLTTTSGNANSVVSDVLDAAFADSATNYNELGDYVKYSLYNGSSTSYSYYKNGNGTYTYTLKYSISYKVTAAQSAAFEKKLNKTMKSLKLGKKSNAKKAKKIYKYITKKVKYDYRSTSATKYTAYAALNKKKAVCQGYATLYYRMCKKAHVPARVVTGTAGGGNHAWNVVKVGSRYYNADATWDAGTSHYRYFLKSNRGFKGHTRASAYRTSSFNNACPMATRNY